MSSFEKKFFNPKIIIVLCLSAILLTEVSGLIWASRFVKKTYSYVWVETNGLVEGEKNERCLCTTIDGEFLCAEPQISNVSEPTLKSKVAANYLTPSDCWIFTKENGKVSISVMSGSNEFFLVPQTQNIVCLVSQDAFFWNVLESSKKIVFFTDSGLFLAPLRNNGGIYSLGCSPEKNEFSLFSYSPLV